jgi:hypothetical protein
MPFGRLSRSAPEPFSTRAGMKFIGGLPMKPGDEAGGGAVVQLLRRADLLDHAVFITTTRSASVIASTWSWVT